MPTDLTRLRTQISAHFNIIELQTLCFDLGIQYENLPGVTLDDKSRELVQYCGRHGLLSKLISLCQTLRPFMDWLNEIGEAIDCVILCGGYAKRLWPLTEDLSKVLLPVAGKPVLSYVLDFVQQSMKVHQVLISTNRKFAPQIYAFVQSYATNKPISIVEDPQTRLGEKVGPMGALDSIVRQSELRDFLVVAGDNLFGFRLDDFFKFAVTNSNSTNAIFRFEAYTNLAEYGIVKLGEDGMFLDFREKEQVAMYRNVSTGCYLFRKHDSGLISEYLLAGGSADSLGGFLQWLTIKGRPLMGFPFTTHWYDVGTREKLIEANAHHLVDARYGNIEGSSTIEGPVQIAPSATIRDSIVGPHVVVESGAMIKNSIVRESLIMSDAVISSSNVANSIIGPRSRIEGKIVETVCGPNTRLSP